MRYRNKLIQNLKLVRFKNLYIYTLQDLSFWMTFTMKTEPWQWTLDPSSKAEKSDLLRPQTENYQLMKAQIEKAVSIGELNRGYFASLYKL